MSGLDDDYDIQDPIQHENDEDDNEQQSPIRASGKSRGSIYDALDGEDEEEEDEDDEDEEDEEPGRDRGRKRAKVRALVGLHRCAY